MNLNYGLMGGFALAIGLALTSNMAFAGSCSKGDPGYGWSTGNIQYNKQAGTTAYCRVVGNRPDWFIRCTVNKETDPNKSAICEDVNSRAWADMGYQDTQYWADINDDGAIDFCREVGGPGPHFISCIMGPNFDTERQR
jgi:hypothetical protein